MSSEREQFQAQEVRCPADVPAGTPLTWLAQRHFDHGDRLMNLLLPPDFPHAVERGEAGDALAQLALGVEIERSAREFRPGTLHQALRLGATWAEAAAALDITPGKARAVLQAYADGQRNLYLTAEREGDARPVGFTAEQYADVLALTELGDDETSALEGASG